MQSEWCSATLGDPPPWQVGYGSREDRHLLPKLPSAPQVPSGLLLSQPPEIAASCLPEDFDGDSLEPYTQQHSTRTIELADPDEIGNVFLSPKGEFRARAILRWWRSRRLAFTCGNTMVAYSPEGEVIGHAKIKEVGNSGQLAELRVGDKVISPDGKLELFFKTSIEIVVFDRDGNEHWSNPEGHTVRGGQKKTRPCKGWRSLDSKLKKRLSSLGVCNAFWNEVIDEERAPKNLTDLVQYVLDRHEELALQ